MVPVDFLDIYDGPNVWLDLDPPTPKSVLNSPGVQPPLRQLRQKIRDGGKPQVLVGR